MLASKKEKTSTRAKTQEGGLSVRKRYFLKKQFKESSLTYYIFFIQSLFSLLTFIFKKRKGDVFPFLSQAQDQYEVLEKR